MLNKRQRHNYFSVIYHVFKQLSLLKGHGWKLVAKMKISEARSQFYYLFANVNTLYNLLWTKLLDNTKPKNLQKCTINKQQSSVVKETIYIQYYSTEFSQKCKTGAKTYFLCEKWKTAFLFDF